MDAKNIRIFNGCDVQIENSVMRITVRHHEACLVMLNSYNKWRKFQVTPNNHCRFFFLHTLPSKSAFRLDCVILSIIFWNNYIFWWRDARFSSYLRCWRWNVWRKIDVKTSKLSSWHHARELSYTPSVRQYFLVPVGFTEIPVRYARKLFLIEYFLKIYF